MADWVREIEELHEFFEAYFLGEIDSSERVEAALAPDFTFVRPDGTVADRAATVHMIEQGHAHTSTLSIDTSEHRLYADAGGLLVAGYVETHDLDDRKNRRRSTAVFRRDPSAPNSVRWVLVHETWLEH